MSTYEWMLRSCWGWSFWPCTISNQCQPRMTVDLLVVWLEGSICLRSSTYTDLIKPGFDLCGFSVTPLGYTGVKWDAGDQALQMVVGSSGFAKKKRGGSCWHIGKTPFASICSLSVEGSSRYLCHPGGIGFTLGQETSLGERRHATTNCHLGWPCSKFVPRMAWSELNQVSTDQRPWSFDDGSDLTGQRCIRSFMELFFFFLLLICMPYMFDWKTISPSHCPFIHWCIPGRLGCQPLRDFSTSTSWLEQPLRRTWIFINYVRVSNYTVAKFWLRSEADL